MDGTSGNGPGWQVVLLGGASGSGKTRLGYPLAQRHGVPLVEVDDIVEAVQAMSTPEQQPALHHWNTRPQDADLPVERVVELQLAICAAVRPAVEAVIANHLRTRVPVVIEGDYLLPALAAQRSFAGVEARTGEVRAAFVREGDVDQLVRNYQEREPEEGPQPHRARVSARYGDVLAEQATALGLPVIEARPWATAGERLTAGLA
ncbi:AAA family ATPase [Streptomyces sp. NPDC050610]|uniref:AAA family ATPase n=1 Tax=Streptomyces sp. NPDC050610 TaxID=3157097 RepID=UPI003443B920